mgnify:CR=1 FL=1
MLFITLWRFRKKPTKEMLAESQRLFEQVNKAGGKVLGFYWTLGRYDGVTIVEGPDEKTAMKSLLGFADLVSTETLVAITSEEASKLVE